MIGSWTVHLKCLFLGYRSLYRKEELCCRSARACISQNGSYSRQAELRLLQALYPGEEGQLCSSANGHRHSRRSADAWSSDDEETARREPDSPPPAGKQCFELISVLACAAVRCLSSAVPGVMCQTMSDK